MSGHHAPRGHFTKHNTSAGRTGETYFDNALRKGGFYDRFTIVRSLSIPGARGDVDAAIAGGNELLLVDAKRWGGEHLRSLPGGWLPTRDGKPLTKTEVETDEQGVDREIERRVYRTSRNMAMAVDRYRAELPRARIRAVVVFVPRSDREREAIPNVRRLFWGEGLASFLKLEWIRSLPVGQCLEFIDRGVPENTPPTPEITAFLNRMKRDS